jgi:hypothetical protein
MASARPVLQPAGAKREDCSPAESSVMRSMNYLVFSMIYIKICADRSVGWLPCFHTFFTRSTQDSADFTKRNRIDTVLKLVQNGSKTVLFRFCPKRNST